MNKIIILLFLLLGINTLYSQEENNCDNETRIQYIENDIRRIENQQLNYKIEKDLLKETYSSNFQTINIVLTIILGLFSIIGFTTIKDIGRIKKDYSEELQNLIQVKEKFENEKNQIESNQTDINNKLLDVIKENESQNRKLKVFELQEKSLELLQRGQVSQAISYVSIALEIEPENVKLNEIKALSLCKLNEFENSLLIWKKLIEISENNKSYIMNALEIAVIVKDFNVYADLLKMLTKKDIEEKNDVFLIFEILSEYQNHRIDQMKLLMKKFIETVDILSFKSEKKWSFTEIYSFLRTIEKNENKEILIKFFDYCSKNVNEQFKAELMELL